MIKLASTEEPMASNEQQLSNQSNFYTGRYLMSLTHEDMDFSGVKNVLKNELGLKVAQMGDFDDKESVTEKEYEDSDMMIFEDIGVALLGIDEDQSEVASALSVRGNFILEPEEVIMAPDPQALSVQNKSTWGITATDVDKSSYSGKGVKIAILDTGFDFKHPDFSGRTIQSKSFVPNESADDINGHGTHCTGTACGHKDSSGVRYGVAYDSDIFIGKVLGGKKGQGTDSWILSGINWAVSNNCQIISMSLGSRVFPGQGHKLAYERAAKYALKQGSLIIAASGNDSHRPFNINPIGSPANVPSIMSVAAVDSNLKVARFSNRAINPGTMMEISGPGVGVYSSWITSTKPYNTISGTSMATPHVAGIAGLYAEKFPIHTPIQLWGALTSQAKPLSVPVGDYGAGLVLAP
ncbi:S8 family peptidase [Reichenbachiella versicolor]|uniref:S8 family peptidase n=1 Tax=Reichenbachiella versicolor TaxID=1821036 RepID=UPI000D6E6EAF|nr:S8 family serine peptidase [Reichenbachiella versicolor]